MVANLASGELVQRCYDPDCRGYRSPPWPLPGHAPATKGAPPEEISDELLGLISVDREYYRMLKSTAPGDPAGAATGGTTGTQAAAAEG